MKRVFRFRFASATVLAFVLVAGESLPNSSAQTDSAPPSDTSAATSDNGSGPVAGTLPPDIDPNSPLAQVVSLAQAGVEQSVILNYINNSGGLFNLDSDKIIYLNDLGVPTDVINAMMQHDQQLEQQGVAPASTQSPGTTETMAQPAEAQPAEVTVNYFYDTLSPYGAWVNVSGFGWCWRPVVTVYDSGWQPYCNNGHWVYTDHGWFWMSGYSWGWAAFHYGRWFHNARYGWCWWPDTTWAPSWVCWRYNHDYCGWAPLPPHAVYQPGVGLVYNGHTVTGGFHFALDVSAFTFVRTRDFCDRDPWHHRIRGHDMDDAYHHTEPFHRIDFDRHNGTVINPGIPAHDISVATRQQIHPVSVRYQVGTPAPGNHHERFDQGHNTLVVSRPHFVGSSVLTVNHGTTSTPAQGHTSFHGNNPQVRPSNPTQGNFQHPNNEHPSVNPVPNGNLNHANPQTPQIRQPAVPHTGWPNSGTLNRATVTPSQNVSPNQTQTPRYNNFDNRNLSPRSRGFEQQSPRNSYQDGWQRNQQSTTPPENRNSPQIEQRDNQYHSSTFQSGPRNDGRNFNRFDSQQRPVQPHPNNPASSQGAQHYNNNNNNNNKDQNNGH